ncbi:MAG: sensor histidine kinase [Bacteroidales bacterium]
MRTFFYRFSRQVSISLVLFSVILVISFLYVSNNLVKELSEEERSKAQIWANATSLISSGEDLSSSTVDLIFSVLQSNKTIPVIVLDSNGELLLQANIDGIKTDLGVVSRAMIEKMKKNSPIEIYLDDKDRQYLYYDDSVLLKKLSYYPYIQLGVMIVFLIIVYMAIISYNRAEQNQVWVGLTKETAHQLGTPISSLMAWVEVLRLKDVDHKILLEIDKDVNRLERVADRFSKIGSSPELKSEDLASVVQSTINYMSTRTSSKIEFTCNIPSERVGVLLSTSLFEWVIENLCRNAVDAIEREGKIVIDLFLSDGKAILDITDTGKGISKGSFDQIFRPGYTTKRRGWGLGLTLTKRIVEEYHNGRVYVKSSELNKGTTFRIELPAVN